MSTFYHEHNFISSTTREMYARFLVVYEHLQCACISFLQRTLIACNAERSTS